MKLYPAIDIRGGKVVRLLKGDFDAETVYGDDPVAVAKSFQDAGAQWIHIVDLDAARTGSPVNRQVIADVVNNVEVPVQSGGGVRDESSAEALLSVGVQRIVIGTAAQREPELVDRLAAQYPGGVAVGLDARGGLVATQGWLEGSDVTVLDLVSRFSDSGVAAFVVTDIDRDGTLTGPDVDGLASVLSATDVEVVASGGVGNLEHLKTLAKLNVDGRRLEGVIAGKSIYEGAFTVAEAIEALKVES